MELQNLLQEFEKEGKAYNSNLGRMINFVSDVCDFIVKSVGDNEIHTKVKLMDGDLVEMGIKEFKLGMRNDKCVYLLKKIIPTKEYVIFINRKPGTAYDDWYYHRVADVDEFKMFIENIDRILLSFIEKLKNENGKLKEMVEKLEKVLEAIS